MRRTLNWAWQNVVSVFLAGLFVLLPIAITVAVMAWVGAILRDWLGPKSLMGQGLGQVGARFVTDPNVASVLGWAVALAAIWLLGVFVISLGRNEVEKRFHSLVEQIPIVNILYKPVVQVVDMLKGGGQDDVKGMGVVYCAFGAEGGAGFLGLLVSDDAYRFGDREYKIVYIPTSPVPMSGGIIFAPAASVHKVDMRVDDLMQIYFSIGVMSSKVIPQKYVVPGVPPPDSPEGSP
ncbi:MAG TPA: DUF502 domain-containing protein [Thermoguttaceae bacterium]|nr:DUF502 domain-containing protein [Thermoguttaceae bacterium]